MSRTKTDYVADAVKLTDASAIRRQLIDCYRELEYVRETLRLMGDDQDTAELKEAKKRAQQERLEASAAAELQRARAQAIRAIARLLPKAVQQANAGKPALLRMILRATK